MQWIQLKRSFYYIIKGTLLFSRGDWPLKGVEIKIGWGMRAYWVVSFSRWGGEMLGVQLTLNELGKTTHNTV